MVEASSAVVSSVPGWVKLCSNTAPLAAIAVFTAPYPTIQQIQKEKSVGSLPLLPYSSMIANCFLWLTYGILIEESKVWLTNMVGLCFGLYYFFTFIKFAPPKASTLPGSIRQHGQACLGIATTTLVWIWTCSFGGPNNNKVGGSNAADWKINAANVIGNVAVLICLIMFASPLSALKTVFQTQSAKSIPLPFTLATVLNCFLWSVAGLGEFHDFNIYFPNLLGLGFGLAQVVLKLVFGDGRPSGASAMNKADLPI